MNNSPERERERENENEIIYEQSDSQRWTTESQMARFAAYKHLMAEHESVNSQWSDTQFSKQYFSAFKKKWHI